MTVHDRLLGERTTTGTTPGAPTVARRHLAWSAAAHCVGLDTCTVVGDNLAAMVGAVGVAARHEHRDSAEVLPDGVSNRMTSPNELLVARLQHLELSDDPVNDVVALISSVHDATRHSNDDVHSAATITAVVRDGASIAIVHVGDASAVQLRHGALAQLTPLSRCHTLAADLRAAGRHPNARADTVVTRVVGGADDLIVDVTKVPIEPGRTSYVVVAHPPPDLVDLVEAAGHARSANEALDSIRAVLPADTAAIIVEVQAPGSVDADNCCFDFGLTR